MRAFKEMKMKCMHCGKELTANSVRGTGFCDKVCKTNFEYRKRFKGGWDENVPSIDKIGKLK